MCAEIEAENPGMDVDGRGVNAVGHESANADATSGRTLPWLQDTAPIDAWGQWNVVQRDCFVLDPYGRLHAIYNLTLHNLGVPAYYDELKALILEAEAAPPP
jgi:hypothetical protein